MGWLLAACRTAAVIAVPIGAGALVGVAVSRWRGRRWRGVLAALILGATPVVVATALVLHFPVVGIWDAIVEGALAGAGALLAAHEAFTASADITTAMVSCGVALVVLELACRMFLAAPPAFPTAGGPHFFLADAMRAGTKSFSWDLRSKEIVCAIAYGDQYAGLLDVAAERDIVTPRTFVPRAGVARRVLHVGDSMTFGMGVARTEAFPALLGRLEPETEHVNAAIPGIAPDGYVAVLHRWIAAHPIDLAVMYVFEGNDVAGLDDRYPCCRWRSLFTYGPEGAAMRCPTADLDMRAAGFTWLWYNSPPPYVVRMLIPHSAAAGHVAAAIVNQMPSMPLLLSESEAEQFDHLERLLRTARDDLQARGVAFAVVVLPVREWVEHGAQAHHLAPEIAAVARRVGIAVLDASDVVAGAAARGDHLFLDPPDPHFAPAGHAVLAAWLHEKLAMLR